MKTASRVTLMLGAGIFALVALSAQPTYAQAANPNAYPDPYQMQEDWAKLPPGRKWGSTIGIEIDPDGKSLWTFDRCAAGNCRGSTLDPVMKFDPNGRLQTRFGGGLINDPHGFHVDREGNVWVSDTFAEGGKGQTVTKFSKDGKVLMTLGKPGVTGDSNSSDAFDQPTDIYVAPNGDIFVSQGHGARPTDRIFKFSKDGKFIKSWGKRGRVPASSTCPHQLAMDSTRPHLRRRSRKQPHPDLRSGRQTPRGMEAVRTPERPLHRQVRQCYSADHQSGATAASQPRLQEGHSHRQREGRQGGVLHPEIAPDANMPEGIAANSSGIIYGGWTGKMNVRRWIKGSTQ